MIQRLLTYLFIIIFINATFTACSDDDDEEEEATSEFDSHAVDLGLPSGVLWSDVNLGASAPEDYGDFFAWGEVETKSNYSWETYKYGKANALTKYVPKNKANSIGNNGFYDDKTQLERTDDAAAVNLGGKWRTPTKADWDELSENATWTWETLNDIEGYRVTGPTGKSIFLPTCGGYNGPTLRFAGFGGAYWTPSFVDENPVNGVYFYFRNGSRYFDDSERYFGRSIRPVKD